MDSPRSTKMVDRQVGRNAELFAASIARLGTPQDRQPYLRILISIIEQAHPEWKYAPNKTRQIAALVRSMARVPIDEKEIEAAIRLRDYERDGHG
jgi:hypothetical protein